MTFLRAIADVFRKAPKDQKVDRYGILSPLMATGEYVQSTSDMCKLLEKAAYAQIMNGRDKTSNSHVEKSVQAYHNYVKGLSGQEQAMERNQPFSSMMVTLDSVNDNLRSLEDNFQSLFGTVEGENAEKGLKSSSLVAIGYLEKADNFCTWICSFIEHLTADEGDMIPPFRTREMLGKATEASEFASLNLNKWNSKRGGLLSEIKLMQTKGADMPLQAASGEWIDEFAHDSQFTPDEKDLIVASLRNPMLIMINWGHVRTQARIELLTARKEWLTAKTIQEQSKLRGLDVNSPEYKKLKKASERYAGLISKYEQQIERMRG